MAKQYWSREQFDAYQREIKARQVRQGRITGARYGRNIASGFSSSMKFGFINGQLSIYSLLTWIVIAMLLISVLRRFLTGNVETYTFTSFIKQISLLDTQISSLDGIFDKVYEFIDFWPQHGFAGFLSDLFTLPLQLLILLIEMIGVLVSAIIAFFRIIGWITFMG